MDFLKKVLNTSFDNLVNYTCVLNGFFINSSKIVNLVWNKIKYLYALEGTET